MTDKPDLDELARLLEKATPGPWEAIGTDPAEGGDWFWIKAQPSPALRGFTKEIGAVNGSQSDPQQQANAALIVALRNAAPSLIAEVEGLRGEVARLKAEMERRSANEIKHCLNWGPCSEMDTRAALGEDGK